MTRKICGLYGALLMLGLAASSFGSSAAQDLRSSAQDEEVRVTSPYTILQQALPRSLSESLLISHIIVEKSVSFSDLDLTKQADVDKMKDRIRQAAKDSCRELNRRFPRALYIPVDDTNCVRDATYRSLARLDEVRGRYGLSARAR